MKADVEEALSEAIKAALSREEDRLRVGFYRPSLLPSCLKRQFLIYKRGLSVSEEKAGLFEIGRMFHEFLSRAFKDKGLTIKAVEAPFIIVSLCGDELIRINGRADLIISLNGEDYIIEVKSIRSLPNEPFKHHVQQLQLYLDGYGINRGFLIYLEKTFLRNRIFPINFNLEEFKRLLNRAAKLHECLINDVEPQIDAEPWECRFCEFKNECGKNQPKRGEGV